MNYDLWKPLEQEGVSRKPNFISAMVLKKDPTVLCILKYGIPVQVSSAQYGLNLSMQMKSKVIKRVRQNFTIPKLSFGFFAGTSGFNHKQKTKGPLFRFTTKEITVDSANAHSQLYVISSNRTKASGYIGRASKQHVAWGYSEWTYRSSSPNTTGNQAIPENLVDEFLSMLESLKKAPNEIKMTIKFLQTSPITEPFLSKNLVHGY